MQFSNDIVLRSRFKKEPDRSNESALKAFEVVKKEQSGFVVTRIYDRELKKFPNGKRHY